MLGIGNESGNGYLFGGNPVDAGAGGRVHRGEQSTGTFTAVPGETEPLKERHGARIERITPLEQVAQPSLPGALAPPAAQGCYSRGEIVVSFPLHNFGPSIPNLMACVAGNLYELRELSGLRLVDLELPEDFKTRYPGPRFGIEGTRRITGVRGRPIIGTIIKPSVGLGRAELEALVYDLAVSGVDFIKDDELNANPPYLLPAGKSGDGDAGHRESGGQDGAQGDVRLQYYGRHRRAATKPRACGQGGRQLRNGQHQQHRFRGTRLFERLQRGSRPRSPESVGMLTRHGQLGMDFRVYQKLCRLAGADHLHVNGLGSKFYESDESVARSVEACLQPMWDGYSAMPVLSSGQWAGTAETTFERTRSVDVMHLAGGGILAHPDGPAAGVESMKQGWEAAMRGIPAEEYAKERVELRRAFDKFKRKERAL